jgi:hypothetical protein
MSSRISPRQLAIAGAVGADDAEYSASRARGILGAIARQNRADYQAECEARAERSAPRWIARLTARDETSRIGGRS